MTVSSFICGACGTPNPARAVTCRKCCALLAAHATPTANVFGGAGVVIEPVDDPEPEFGSSQALGEPIDVEFRPVSPPPAGAEPPIEPPPPPGIDAEPIESDPGGVESSWSGDFVEVGSGSGGDRPPHVRVAFYQFEGYARRVLIGCLLLFLVLCPLLALGIDQLASGSARLGAVLIVIAAAPPVYGIWRLSGKRARRGRLNVRRKRA